MTRFFEPVCFSMLFVVGVLMLGLAGCGDNDREDESTQQPAEDARAAEDADRAAAANDAAVDPDDSIAATLAQLSPEDRALAEQQKICPVAEAPLGSMGVPIKLTVEGRDVFICCAGCETALRNDPETYFARLDDHPDH